MNPDAVLAAIISVAAAFIGFTGVIFAVGRFSQGQWTPTERNALMHLLLPSTLALFLAFVPMVLLTGVGYEAGVWRASNGLLAVIHAPLVSRALWLAIRAELVEPLPLRFVLIPLGFASVIASALAAFGFLQGYSTVAFTGGLVIFLLVAAIQFVLLVIPDAN
jgi:hypothetical protein